MKVYVVENLKIERFSFAFTANGKREAAACRKSKKKYLILAYFSVY